MGGLTDKLRAFLDANHVGVLGTVTSSGKPRQSLVYYIDFVVDGHMAVGSAARVA